MRDDGSSVLDRFRQGDLDAFEMLFRMHQRIVFSWAFRILRDRGAAEDVTIEAFWRIYQARARFEPARGFEPWARRIAARAALDWLRRQKPESTAAPEVIDDAVAPRLPDAAVSAEIREKTALAFSRLPARLRIAAVLAVVEDRPYKEVAEALGITVAAVKLRVFRALRLLRRDLNEMGIQP